MKQLFSLVLCALLLLPVFAGCTTDQPTAVSTAGTDTIPTTAAPIEDTYEYTAKSGFYFMPSVYDPWIESSALTTTTNDGTFFCMTEDTQLADDFIVSQRILLRLLRENGVETGRLEYYATSYGDSFSRSSEAEAYIALDAVRTQQQVLVTLQALWGDYTEYGYVWVLSHAIAGELGWEKESVPAVTKAEMDAFFKKNAEAVRLLYPTFTAQYAPEETVNCCKALAASLFEKINWQDILAKPVGEQIFHWQRVVDDYAKEIGISFVRDGIGYAYFGENVPLRIMTPYVEMMVDANYCDQLSDVFAPYFSDYQTIYQTVNAMNGEITAAVDYFGMEEDVGIITMKWVNCGDYASQRYLDGNTGVYFHAGHTAYVGSIAAYLHEYYHHLCYLMSGDTRKSWQSEAFSEMGAANSYWARYAMDQVFAEDVFGFLFYFYTGRSYQSGRDDYYEVMDIICHMNNMYTLKYHDGGPTMSMSHYLIDCYGEETAYQLVAFPDAVEQITGMTWEELAAQWEQHIRDKYAHVDISDWINS